MGNATLNEEYKEVIVVLDYDGAPFESATFVVTFEKDGGAAASQSESFTHLGEGRYEFSATFTATGFWKVEIEASNSIETLETLVLGVTVSDLADSIVVPVPLPPDGTSTINASYDGHAGKLIFTSTSSGKLIFTSTSS